MRWPWSRPEPAKLNGHGLRPGGPVAGGVAVVLDERDFPLTLPAATSGRRADRHADDNYAPPGIGRYEIERMARHARSANGRPQRIHDHPEGHLCTARCGVLEP